MMPKFHAPTKIIFGILILLFLIAAILVAVNYKKLEQPKQIQINNVNVNPMQITSSAFLNNQLIPAKYTCDGEGINPPLNFLDAPKQAVSLVLVVDDPDAPSFASSSAKATSDLQKATEGKPNGTWVHWLVWNINPNIQSIAENSVPQGAIQGKTSSGQNLYGGPCPPVGRHRYYFKLYALDSKLKIPSYSTSAELEQAMTGHIISQAQLVGLYRKNQ